MSSKKRIFIKKFSTKLWTNSQYYPQNCADRVKYVSDYMYNICTNNGGKISHDYLCKPYVWFNCYVNNLRLIF